MRIKDEESETGFDYSIIKDIILVDGEKIFAVNKLEIIKFERHLCAFQVERKQDVIQLILFKSLFSHGVLHLKEK